MPFKISGRSHELAEIAFGVRDPAGSLLDAGHDPTQRSIICHTLALLRAETWAGQESERRLEGQ